jgi:ADP-ribose pyrophosphatase YjhB (NUDIX family)
MRTSSWSIPRADTAGGLEMTYNGLHHGIEPAVRRLLHVFWRFSRAMTLGVRGVVLRDDGTVFLVRHSYVSGWHLPGGGVEVGESVVEALARELAEEGNITLAGAPQLHGVFHNATDSPRDHVVVFVVRGFRQEGQARPSREIVEHGFFAVDALPPEATPGTRRRVAEVCCGAPIAARW